MKHNIGDLVIDTYNCYGTIIDVERDGNKNYFIIHWYKLSASVKYTAGAVGRMKGYLKNYVNQNR